MYESTPFCLVNNKVPDLGKCCEFDQKLTGYVSFIQSSEIWTKIILPLHFTWHVVQSNLKVCATATLTHCWDELLLILSLNQVLILEITLNFRYITKPSFVWRRSRGWRWRWIWWQWRHRLWDRRRGHMDMPRLCHSKLPHHAALCEVLDTSWWQHPACTQVQLIWLGWSIFWLNLKTIHVR